MMYTLEGWGLFSTQVSGEQKSYTISQSSWPLGTRWEILISTYKLRLRRMRISWILQFAVFCLATPRTVVIGAATV